MGDGDEWEDEEEDEKVNLTHILSPVNYIHAKERLIQAHASDLLFGRADGVSFFPIGDKYEEMLITIGGLDRSPYASGVFFPSLDLRAVLEIFD